MTKTHYIICKVCKGVKPLDDLFKCAHCNKICCFDHAKEELALCPSCYSDVLDELGAEEGGVKDAVAAAKQAVQDAEAA